MNTSLREHARAWYAGLLVASGAVDRLRRRSMDQAVVLLYHRVLPEDAIRPDIDPGMYVGRSTFEAHLQYLSSHYEMLSLDGLMEWLNEERTTYKPPCVITFDDGWVDNYTTAFPLLRQYKMPATIFVITDLVDTPEMLTWAQIHEMREAGISFGSHTASHPVLTRVEDAAVVDELTKSKERLEREFGQPCRWFCYPKGQHDGRSLRAARQLYAGAVGTVRRAVRRGCDVHRIPRIGMHHDIARTTALFACRLALLV